MYSLRRLFPVLAVLVLALLTTACGDQPKNATDLQQVPSGVQPSDANQLPTDIQQLKINIANGKFEKDLYEVQTGATQLVVTADGGPYTLSVSQLFADQQVQAGAATKIGFTAPNPGDYPMTLSGSGAKAQAILRVHTAGGSTSP